MLKIKSVDLLQKSTRRSFCTKSVKVKFLLLIPTWVLPSLCLALRSPFSLTIFFETFLLIIFVIVQWIISRSTLLTLRIDRFISIILCYFILVSGFVLVCVRLLLNLHTNTATTLANNITKDNSFLLFTGQAKK